MPDTPQFDGSTPQPGYTLFKGKDGNNFYLKGENLAPDDVMQRVAKIRGQSGTAGPPMPSMPTPIPAGLQGPPTIPEMEASRPDAQRGMGAPQSLPQAASSLPQFGGAIGGSLGGIPGAALGGVVGEGINQGVKAAGRPLNETLAENPAWQMIKSGLEQGGFEFGGKFIVGAGKKIVPNVVKKAAAKVLEGPMDTAGQAIDTYLQQPNLANQRVNIAKPINDLLNDEIAVASRTSQRSLTARLKQVQTDWNRNYNLNNPTLAEANAFRREIAKFTNFSGDAHKVTLNQIQKRVNGVVGEVITQAAPGVAPLNANYANLVPMQSAIKSGAKSATSGIKGAALAGSSLALQKTGQIAPTVARGTQLLREKNGEE